MSSGQGEGRWTEKRGTSVTLAEENAVQCESTVSDGHSWVVMTRSAVGKESESPSRKREAGAAFRKMWKKFFKETSPG